MKRIRILILWAVTLVQGSAQTKTVGPNGEGVNASAFRSAIGAPATGDIPTWSTLSGRPSTFAPDVSAIADGALSIAKTSGLQTALDVKIGANRNLGTVGYGFPSNATGSNGDYWTDASLGINYLKIDGHWFPASLRTPFLTLKPIEDYFALPTLTCYAAAASAGMVPIHPSVVKFPTAWNGYKYWMAYTPYGTSGQQYENPCIACSTDGYTWIDVPGVTNPLVAKPAGDYYNSDTNLFAENGQLVMTYRETAAQGEYIKAKTSSDGVTWSAPITVIDNTAVGRSTNILAQSVFPKDGGGYEMWATDNKDTNGTTMLNSLKRYTASALTGPWTCVSLAVFHNVPAGKELWHADVHKIAGRYVALIPFGTSHVGDTYFAESEDGLNFYLGPKVTSWLRRSVGQPYKCAWWLDVDAANNEPVVRMVLGNGGEAASSGISNALCRFAVEPAVAEFYRKLDLSLTKRDKFIVGDAFRRDDGVTGTAPTGQTWTFTTTSTNFYISNNKLEIINNANNIALVDSGKADCRITLKYNSRTLDDTGIIFRAIDNYDCWKLGFSSSGASMTLYRISWADNGNVSETTTQQCAWQLSRTGTEIISVECNGSLITVFVNGVKVYEVTDSRHSTRTKHGIYGRPTVTGGKIIVDGFFIESL